MSKSMMQFTKGVVTGVVVGTTIGAVMHGHKPAKHTNNSPFAALKMAKNAGKIARNISGVVTKVADIF